MTNLRDGSSDQRSGGENEALVAFVCLVGLVGWWIGVAALAARWIGEAEPFFFGSWWRVADVGGGIFASWRDYDVMRQSMFEAINTSACELSILPEAQTYVAEECPFCGNSKRQQYAGPIKMGASICWGREGQVI